jgi:deoxyribonuclease-4
VEKVKNLTLGAHVSIVGGLEKSVERTLEIGGNCMQIFTKSNRSWYAKNIDPEAASVFRNAVKKADLRAVVVHASYLINLASPKEETRKKSLSAFVDELRRCDQLGVDYLVIHPGSHVGDGLEVGVERIAKGINSALAQAKPNTMLLLETMAGQGSSIGTTFDELAMIYEKLEHKTKVGFCFDTCHVFSAGYDIATPDGMQNALDEFDRVIGSDKIKAVHLNDSKKPLNSRVDRHENIGKGALGEAGIAAVIKNSVLSKLPLILETPETDGLSGYAQEIKILKGL